MIVAIRAMRGYNECGTIINLNVSTSILKLNINMASKLKILLNNTVHYELNIKYKTRHTTKTEPTKIYNY